MGCRTRNMEIWESLVLSAPKSESTSPAYKAAKPRETEQPALRRQDVLKLVEPDSEVRRLFKDRQTSDLKKYIWLTAGDVSFWRFVYFELVTFLLGGMRGALGLFLRRRFYPRTLKECGSGVVFGRNVTIRHPQRICIGNNVVLDDNVVLDAKGEEGVTLKIADNTIVGRNSAIVCKGGTIDIQADVNISVNCTLISESQLSIGSKTLVAGHCYVIAGGNHGTDFSGIPFVDQPRTQLGGIEVLENCWLGAQSTILDGIRVGPNSIVGAAALVNHDVPPDTVVAGVPAKAIEIDKAKKVRSRNRRAR